MEFHGKAVYADRVLSQTVVILAIGPGDVRSRILEAYGVFHPLTVDHFPAHLRADFDWVQRKLMAYGPRYDQDGELVEAAVQVGLRRMRNATGVEIARRLVRLQSAVESYVSRR